MTLPRFLTKVIRTIDVICELQSIPRAELCRRARIKSETWVRAQGDENISERTLLALCNGLTEAVAARSVPYEVPWFFRRSGRSRSAGSKVAQPEILSTFSPSAVAWLQYQWVLELVCRDLCLDSDDVGRQRRRTKSSGQVARARELAIWICLRELGTPQGLVAQAAGVSPERVSQLSAQVLAFAPFISSKRLASIETVRRRKESLTAALSAMRKPRANALRNLQADIVQCLEQPFTKLPAKFKRDLARLGVDGATWKKWRNGQSGKGGAG